MHTDVSVCCLQIYPQLQYVAICNVSALPHLSLVRFVTTGLLLITSYSGNKVYGAGMCIRHSGVTKVFTHASITFCVESEQLSKKYLAKTVWPWKKLTMDEAVEEGYPSYTLL